MRFKGAAYRGHNPKWSFAPTSGQGAAIHGGRFNPQGVPALYLALSPEGAFIEATQGLAYKFNPLTLCAYDIDCENILDLATEQTRAKADVDLSTLQAPWMQQRAEGQSPRSWDIHKRFSSRFVGIVVPSFAHTARPDMKNLVLWRWSSTLPHKVQVHDPDSLLPIDQRSWPQ